jgi:hypothetical protein
MKNRFRLNHLYEYRMGRLDINTVLASLAAPYRSQTKTYYLFQIFMQENEYYIKNPVFMACISYIAFSASFSALHIRVYIAEVPVASVLE